MRWLSFIYLCSSLVCLFVPCPTIKLTCPCLSLCVGYFPSYFNSLLSCVCYVHFCFPVSLVRFCSPVPSLLCLVFLIISCISTVDRDTGVLASKRTSPCSTDTAFWRKALWSEMGANWSKFLNFTSNKQLDCHKFNKTGGFSNRTWSQPHIKNSFWNG